MSQQQQAEQPDPVVSARDEGYQEGVADAEGMRETFGSRVDAIERLTRSFVRLDSCYETIDSGRAKEAVADAIRRLARRVARG